VALEEPEDSPEVPVVSLAELEDFPEALVVSLVEPEVLQVVLPLNETKVQPSKKLINSILKEKRKRNFLSEIVE